MKTIFETTKELLDKGKIDLHEAACRMFKAGWTNFIDEKRTLKLLDM